MPSQDLIITDVSPRLGVPGGEVAVCCRGFMPGLPSESRVLFGNTPAEIVSASRDKVIVRVPEDSSGTGLCLMVGDRTSPVFPFATARKLAAGLHPVTSPVVAADGTLITTISGSRGHKVSQPLVRVTRGGEKTHFSCEIMNPTGLALGPDGQLYVSSRNDGAVYRYADFERLETVVEDLGVACGIAFDTRGRLYVGDRTGHVYRVDAGGHREEFARLEPSVSAYHLAIDPEDAVYITGPTFALRDSVYRISQAGAVEVVFRGLARPQGMAVLPDGDLLVTACHEGKKGLFRLAPQSGRISHFVSAPTLVGVAVAGVDMFLADHQAVHWAQFPAGSALAG